MITDYASLQTTVVDWVANQKVQGVVDECIQLAEARIRNDLLLRRIERAQHGQLSGAVIFLPPDCGAVQRLMFYIGTQEISVPYTDPQSMERLTASVGDPQAYTMMDQAIILYPTPSTARDYSLYYVPTVGPLTDANPTNWLLERSPNVYLLGACLEACLYLHETDRAGAYEGRYKQALDALQQASERQRMPSLTAMNARAFRTVRC